MSIQQNINQTLSLASFVMGQTPWAEEQRLKKNFSVETKNMAMKAQAMQRAAEQVEQELYPEGKTAEVRDPETGEVKKTVGRAPTLSGEALDEEESRAAEMYRRSAELTQSVFERRPGQPNYSEVMALNEKARDYEDRVAKRKETRRVKAEKKAREEAAAARELENARLEPKGLTRDAVESRLWKREDKK